MNLGQIKPDLSKTRYAARLELWHYSFALSLVALLGLSLPWVWIDDAPGPHNAGQLMLLAPKSHDIKHLLFDTPVAALTSFVMPIVIGVCAVAASLNIVFKPQPNSSVAVINSIIFGCALLVLMGCASIVEPETARIGPITMPRSGLALVIVSSLAGALLSAVAVIRKRHNQADEEAME